MAGERTDVNLSEHHRRFINLQVESGRHRTSSDVVREALRRYESDLAAETAAIDVLWDLAEKSGSGEISGDFTDVQDQSHLDRLNGANLDRALERARTRVG